MKKSLVFRTFEEFEQTCFPIAYEQRKIEKMTPEEYGKYLAEKGMQKVREILSS